MVATASTMLELGTKAPGFELPNIDESIISLADFSDAKALLVMFLSNHCPYVIHIRSELVKLYSDFHAQGLAMVAIMSNDVEKYPDDHPDKMKIEVEQVGYQFPYLFDESQEVAKSYYAACTPDFFLFDREQKLVYRGQLDSSRPKNDIPVNGEDLRAAIEATLLGQHVSIQQKPSLGCNIKWKEGNAPSYFG